MSTDKSYGTRKKDNTTKKGKNSSTNETLIDGMNENQFHELLEVVVDYKGTRDTKDQQVKVVYNEEKRKADKDLQSARKSLQSDYPLAHSPTPPVPKPRTRRFNEVSATDEVINASKERKAEDLGEKQDDSTPRLINYICGNQETYAKEFCDSDADDESSNTSDSKNNTKQILIPEHPKKTVKAVPAMFSLLPQNGDGISYSRFVGETPFSKNNKPENEGIKMRSIECGEDQRIYQQAPYIQKIIDLVQNGHEENKSHQLFGESKDNDNYKEAQLIHRGGKKVSKGNHKETGQEFEFQEISEEHRDPGSKILVLSGSDEGNATESEGEDQNDPSGLKREKGATTGRDHSKKPDNNLPIYKQPPKWLLPNMDEKKMSLFHLENDKNKDENGENSRTFTYRNRCGKMVKKEIKRNGKKNDNVMAEQHSENSIGRKKIEEILAFLEEPVVDKKTNNKNKEKKRKSKESKDEISGLSSLTEKQSSFDSRKDGENELQDDVFEETIPINDKKNKAIPHPPSSPTKMKTPKREEPSKENPVIEMINQSSKDELFITVSKSKKTAKSVDGVKKLDQKFNQNPKITTAKSFDQDSKSTQKPGQPGREKRNSSDSCRMSPKQSSSKLPPDLDSYPALEKTLPIKSEGNANKKKPEAQKYKRAAEGEATKETTKETAKETIKGNFEEVEKNDDNERANKIEQEKAIVTEESRRISVEERVVLPTTDCQENSDSTIGISFFFDERLASANNSTVPQKETPKRKDEAQPENRRTQIQPQENSLLKDPVYLKIVDSWKSFQSDSKPYVYSASESR